MTRSSSATDPSTAFCAVSVFVIQKQAEFTAISCAPFTLRLSNALPVRRCPCRTCRNGSGKSDRYGRSTWSAFELGL